MAVGIVFEPGVVARTILVVAPPEPRRCPGPSCVFPFRLGGQPIRTITLDRHPSAQLAVQPRDVGPRIIPAHAYHGVAVRLGEAGILPIQIRLLVPFEAILAASITRRISCLANKNGVFGACDIILAQSKRSQRDTMLRRFIGN